MTAKVIYTGGLHTVATHLRSGSEIETDAPIDNKGKGERFSPTDLLATALATCIATTMGIAANTRNINIDGLECDVEKIMAADPRRVSEVKIDLRFPKDMQYTDKEKAMLEHTARTCPVGISLHPDCKQTLNFLWG